MTELSDATGRIARFNRWVVLAVGLGLLWQESLLAGAGRSNIEVHALNALLRAWGLPVSLPSGLDLERLCADALAPEETVHLLGLPLDAATALAHLPHGR